MSYLNENGLARYDGLIKQWVTFKSGTVDGVDPLLNWQRTGTAGAVTFQPLPAAPIDPVVNFAFTETGPAEGTKGPDNPSTIAGVSSVKVTRTGKNLLYYPYKQQTKTSNGVTFTANEDGTVTINGTATGSSFFSVCDSGLGTTAVSSKIRLIKGLNYTGSFKIVSGSFSGTLWFAANKKDSGQDAFSPGITPGNSSQINWSNGNADEYMRYFLCAVNGSTFNNLVVSCQLELGSVATAFEPYEGADYTVNLGGTFYGGSVDVSTGVMTVTYRLEEISSAPFEVTTQGNVNVFRYKHYSQLQNNISYVNNNSACTHFSYVTSSSVGVDGYSFSKISLYFYSTTITTVEGFAAWLQEQKDAGTPVLIAYPISTPFTVQLTPLQIYSLSQPDPYTPRINTVYSDQVSVQVGYPKSPQATSTELTNAIISLGSNL